MPGNARRTGLSCNLIRLRSTRAPALLALMLVAGCSLPVRLDVHSCFHNFWLQRSRARPHTRSYSSGAHTVVAGDMDGQCGHLLDDGVRKRLQAGRRDPGQLPGLGQGM